VAQATRLRSALNQFDQLLAEILSFEQADESLRCVLKTLGDAFAIFYFSVVHELTEFGQSGFRAI
jgi:hypothetical protein